MAGRFALLIATSNYEDKGLQQLVAPPQDSEALADILSDSSIGDFKVDILLNEPSFTANLKIEAFFNDRTRDDLLLLYFSGHGLKDDEGRLYFATPDTQRKMLRTTTIPSTLIHDVMRYSPSKRQVLILDCCYNGAFPKGITYKAGEMIGASIDTRERFEGSSRLILTASDSLQYAIQGDEIKGESVHSIFTSAIIHGLESGKADLDQDGFISIDELYQYVHDRVTTDMPQQNPRMWTFDVERRIAIARSPTPLTPKTNVAGQSEESRTYSGPVIDKKDGARPIKPSVSREINTRSLREALISHFSMEELKLLCSDVEHSLAEDGINIPVNPEMVGGDTKPVKVLNLITYLDHRGYLIYLVEEVQRQRPVMNFQRPGYSEYVFIEKLVASF
jgi:hypothetical protein